ncbi:S1-like domain-containing RNA-binding protein, partial [Peptoniphilus sp. oral taxon 386]
MKLGRCELEVKKVLKKEIILTNGKEDIKLKEFDDKLKVGEKLNVFIYDSSKDNRVATIQKTLLDVGEVAKLKIADKTKF